MSGDGICIMLKGNSGRRRAASLFISAAVTLLSASPAWAGAIPQKNVNAIGPTPVKWLLAGNPRMQQNEPECAVSPNNLEWLACGFNDYRAVNDPNVGDAFPGIAMSRDSGKTWISGLHPGHLGDIPTIDKKFGADANLEALPNLLMYNFIAGWRDDSQPGGVYVSRWYEHNREVGPPWEHLDTIEVDLGTSGKFLDKPAFDVALYNPSLGRAPIQIPIPQYDDPRNISNSHPAYTLFVPAARAHLCYAVFVGNDNNDGTKINCLASDDGGLTWPVKSKLTESVDINQGVSIATRNSGQDALAVWRRFDDNNETSAIMYAVSQDWGNGWSKAEVLTEFCAFDQSTGPARFRTNALPIAVSNGSEFAVYFAARNDATETCVTQPKGKNKNAVPRMSPVGPGNDFDGPEDGQVRTALNFSRIMMVRGTGIGKNSWSAPEMVDPQLVAGGSNPNNARKPFHQFMPAAEVAAGIETISWFDSRMDKLNRMQTPIVSGFVEDAILHIDFGSDGKPTGGSVLPSFIYDIVPPPTPAPPVVGNFPLRRNIDTFAAQIVNGNVLPYTVDTDFYPDNGGSQSNSVRVSRFATRYDLSAPNGRKQLEFNYPNGRLFRKGRAPFVGDYNTVAAAQFRQLQDGVWTSNQTPLDLGPNTNELFSSNQPVFHVGWTSNHNVRGRVYYTGCDVWDETLQMWVASPTGCASSYDDPTALNPAMMMPLQGEDGSTDGPPPVCQAVLPGQKKPQPLTRNQNIYVAAMKPGVNVDVVSAIKFPDGVGFNTFVLELQNGTPVSSHVRLELPLEDLAVSFSKDSSLKTIQVNVPKGSGNARTVFDTANFYDDVPMPSAAIIVEAYDTAGLTPEQYATRGTGTRIARVALMRESLVPLENVQNNDPNDLRDIIDPEDGEFYDIILKRELGTTQALDLENLDLENTVYMLDLENLDLENLDLENLDLENLDLENAVLFLDLENLDLENVDLSNFDLKNALYEQLDLENLDLENLDLENLDLENRNLFYLDLENLDLENSVFAQLDLENLDLENLDLENLDLENLDLENLDLENFTIYASDLENLDLENLDLENSAPGDEYTEISWTADSATNTTTGIDIKPLFSPSLAEQLKATCVTGTDGQETCSSQVLLTVRQPYLTGTVTTNSAGTDSGVFCTPQVVAENQLIFAALLTPAQINNIISDPDPADPTTPSFILQPDSSKIITLRFINPPPNLSIQQLSRNTGMALYSQPGSNPTCDAELTGVDLLDCEIDFINDLEPPVITLNPGSNTVDQDTAYSDPGATATDNVDDSASLTVVTSGWDGSPAAPGMYTIYYDVSDAAGNEAITVSRTVEVIDTEAPVIVLLGDNPLSIEAGTIVADPGTTASDNFDPVGLFAADSDWDTVVKPLKTGAYIVKYTTADAASNEAIPVERTVNVVDNTAPSIVPNTVDVGGTPVVNLTIEAGNPYVEPGAIVTDNASQDPAPILLTTVFDSNGAEIPAVNTNVVDAYTVRYNATDFSGNSAAAARTVTVVDTTEPEILIEIPPEFTPELGEAILEPGEQTFNISWPVSGADLEAGLAISCSIGSPPQIIEPISTIYDDSTGVLNAVFSYDFEVGLTSVTCTVSDQGENSVTSEPFEVFIEDRPIIDDTTLPSLLPFPVEANDVSGYVGPITGLWDAVLANDQIDITPIEAVCQRYDLATLSYLDNDLLFGDNTIRCTATDSANIPSEPVTFIARVVDTTAPQITTIVSDLTLEANALGGFQWSVPADALWSPVEASDIVDGLVTASCTPDSTSNFSFGDTTVTCIARDSRGNPSGQPGDSGFPPSAYTSFVVSVEDMTAPNITGPLPDPAPAGDPLEANGSNGHTPTTPLWVDPIVGAATDTVDGLTNVNCTPGPSQIFKLGATDISCSSTDARNNTATIAPAFTINVGDTTPPAVTITLATPSPVEATGPGGASVAFTTTAIDIVSGSLATTCSIAGTPVSSPHEFPLDDSALTCVAIDGFGVQGSAMTTVTVEDTTPPTITTTPLVVSAVGASALVSEAQLVANVSATDLVDGTAVSIACPLSTDPTEFPYGTYPIDCTATDNAGNSAMAQIALTVEFPYGIGIIKPKGNIRAGSTVPLDWYYTTNPGSTDRVDSSALDPSVEWFGPFSERTCTLGSDGSGDGAEDSGSSSIRYIGSDQTWRLNWQTPPKAGWYDVVITPPATEMATKCIATR